MQFIYWTLYFIKWQRQQNKFWKLKKNCTSTVVDFDQLLGAVCTQKLVETFFQPFFNLFCSFQSFFSDFEAEITKNIWKWTKNVVLSTPQSWLTYKSWSTPWGGTVLNNFWVRAAPKNWSKYTTHYKRSTKINIWKRMEGVKNYL